MTRGAAESLRTIDKFCAGFPRKILLEVLKAHSRPELQNLTHDCLKFFWDRLSEEERALFVLENLKIANKFAIKWVCCFRDGAKYLNEEVRGQGFPLFCAVDAGVEAVKVLFEVAESVEFMLRRKKGGEWESALDHARKTKKWEVARLLANVCRRPE